MVEEYTIIFIFVNMSSKYNFISTSLLTHYLLFQNLLIMYHFMYLIDLITDEGFRIPAEFKILTVFVSICVS